MMTDEEFNRLVESDHLSLSDDQRRSLAARCKNKEQVCWLVLVHHVQRHMPPGQWAYYDGYQVPNDSAFYVRSISSMMREDRGTLERMYVHGVTNCDAWPLPKIRPDNQHSQVSDMMLDLIELD